MATERTPEEIAAEDRANERILAVLRTAAEDVASWHVAEALDEPPWVCEQWVNRMWDGLRDNLAGEDRLRAILLLLLNDARRSAQTVLDGLVGER